MPGLDWWSGAGSNCRPSAFQEPCHPESTHLGKAPTAQLTRTDAADRLFSVPFTRITSVPECAVSAIPWKRGHFPLADSCDFGSSSDYRTPVHLWFLASVCAPGTGLPDAPRPGRGRPGPARVSGRRGRSGLRGQGRPRRGRRRPAVRSSLMGIWQVTASSSQGPGALSQDRGPAHLGITPCPLRRPERLMKTGGSQGRHRCREPAPYTRGITLTMRSGSRHWPGLRRPALSPARDQLIPAVTGGAGRRVTGRAAHWAGAGRGLPAFPAPGPPEAQRSRPGFACTCARQPGRFAVALRSQPALTLRGGPVPLRGASPGPSAAAFPGK